MKFTDSIYEVLPYESKTGLTLQKCPMCQDIISALPGTRDAKCTNCGFKDPCCE
jgi:hypothetical protein